MIVRPHPAGWRLTLHPAHGLLAAKLYRQLPPEAPGVPPTATLIAVADHDDHQLDFARGHYLTAAGAPQDFAFMAMDDEQRSLQAEALLEGARRKSRWVGRLIGRHYRFLYEGQDVDGRLAAVLADIEAFEARAAADAEPDAAALDLTYGRMRFCDRLSLILCGEELPALGREVEINDGLGEHAYAKQDQEGGVVRVRPWPFAREAFEVSVESYVVAQLSFENSAALGEVLAKAEPEVRRWRLGRG